MLLGKLRERKDETALMYMHSILQSYCSKRPIASLICCTEPNKKSDEETKNKNRDVQKKQCTQNVRGVSPAAARESMVAKICERHRSTDGSEREREL